MGTRHLICVVVDGKMKVAQYGQWDGYPTGQGVDIVNFINNDMDLERFKNAVRECRFVSNKILSQRDVEQHPELSRDTSAKILKMIQDGGVRELWNEKSFAGESLFCEWAYVLDLDKEVLEVYKGFNTGKAVGRFARLKARDGEYKQVTLTQKIPFNLSVEKNVIKISETLMKEIEEKNND
jgi:hypothetical protein